MTKTTTEPAILKAFTDEAVIVRRMNVGRDLALPYWAVPAAAELGDCVTLEIEVAAAPHFDTEETVLARSGAWA